MVGGLRGHKEAMPLADTRRLRACRLYVDRRGGISHSLSLLSGNPYGT